MWSLPPSPSLAPLTELNELSILSVLEESSWERTRGQGEERVGLGGRERDKGKEFSSNLVHNCFSCAAISALVKDSQPETASCPESRHLWDVGRPAQTLRSKAEGQGTFCFLFYLLFLPEQIFLLDQSPRAGSPVEYLPGQVSLLSYHTHTHTQNS